MPMWEKEVLLLAGTIRGLTALAVLMVPDGAHPFPIQRLKLSLLVIYMIGFAVGFEINYND